MVIFWQNLDIGLSPETHDFKPSQHVIIDRASHVSSAAALTWSHFKYFDEDGINHWITLVQLKNYIINS
jgi:hypothetical protein